MRARGLFLITSLALGLSGWAGCSLAVEHGLDEPATNEVIAALERAGIGAEKTQEEGTAPATFTVKVAEGDSLQALDLLRAQGLPRENRPGLGEVFGKPSLVPTQTEERARYIDALSGEIERTLEAVEGVVHARVHVVLEERDGLSVDAKPTVPAQAAVLLKVKAGLLPIKDADVQRLVAGSVPGLNPASVSVVITAAPESSLSHAGLVALGPLRVSAGARAVILAVVAGALGLIALLAALLVITARRLAALERDRPAVQR